MSLSNGMEEYYQKVIQLQERLRQSEEERLKLEMKFNEMLQMMKEEEEAHFKKLRTKYKQFLDDDRRRQQRNDKILEALDRIENRTVMWEAKTEKFKSFRKRYQDYLKYAGSLRSRSPLDVEPTPEPKPSVYEPAPERRTLFSDKDPKGDSTDSKNDIVEKYLQSLSSPKCKEDILQRKGSEKPSPETKYSNLGNINSIYWKTPGSAEKTDPEKAGRFKDDEFDSTQLKTNKDLENSLKQNNKASVPALKKYDYSDLGGSRYLDNYDDANFALDKKPLADLVKKEPVSDFAKESDIPYTQQRFGYNTSETIKSDNGPQALNFAKPSNQSPEQVHNNLEQLLKQHKDETVQNQPLQKTWGAQPPQRTLLTNTQPVQEQFQPMQRQASPAPFTGDGPDMTRPMAEKQLPRQASEITDNLKDEHVLSTTQAAPYPQEMSNGSSPRPSEAGIQKPESPYHQPKPESPYHQPKPESPYQAKPESPYHQAKPESPYRQPKPESPYHQPQPESPYRQPKPESPYHQPQPESPYRQPESPYRQPQQRRPSEMQQPELVNAQPVNQGEVGVTQPTENQAPGQQGIESGGTTQMQPQFEGGYVQPMQYPTQFQQPPKFHSFMMRWKNRAAQPVQQQYVGGNQPPQNPYNGGAQPPQQQYNASEQPVEQNYDANVQPAQQYEANGQPVQQYDANGQPLQQYDGTGQYAQQYYDETGQPLQQYDDSGQPPQQYYDEGQALQNYPEGEQSQSQYYDQNGQPLQQYDENGQPFYDNSGQPQQYDETGQPLPQYDENGQPVTQYDANGQPMPQYDENGQPIPQYDANGQLVTQYDANGQPLQQYYDENGQPVQYYGEGGSAQQYDENGQPIQQQYGDQPYGDQQYYEQQQQPQDAGQQQQDAGQQQQDPGSQQQEQPKAEPKPKVLDMLDTDTESAKQDTKVSNDSDFDFSNG